MRKICINCNINFPVVYRTFRFFEIGDKHDYLDEKKNQILTKKLLVSQVLPILEICQQMVTYSKQRFKIAFCLSGPSMLMFQRYAPTLLNVFRKLTQSGQLKFLIRPYSTPGLYKNNTLEMLSQLQSQQSILRELIPNAHSSFMVKKNNISGKAISEARELGVKIQPFHIPKKTSGFIRKRADLFEDQVIASEEEFHRNGKPEKKPDFLNLPDQRNDIGTVPYLSENKIEFLELNIDYRQNTILKEHSLDMLREVLHIAKHPAPKLHFLHPSECIGSSSWKLVQVDHLKTIDETSGSTNNDLQTETCQYLNYLVNKMKSQTDESLVNDWQFIRDESHLFFMNSRFFEDNFASNHFNPYPSPYMAFINYMNVLEDFSNRLDIALNASAS